MPTAKPMLDGYKVLDFTQVLAGPTTTRYMAEMGAEVVLCQEDAKASCRMGDEGGPFGAAV